MELDSYEVLLNSRASFPLLLFFYLFGSQALKELERKNKAEWKIAEFFREIYDICLMIWETVKGGKPLKCFTHWQGEFEMSNINKNSL